MSQPQIPSEGYAPPPYPGYGYPPPSARTNGLAIASFICSLAALSMCVTAPVGAILGHVARRQIRERGERGAGMALAGVIIGWVITGLVVGFVILGLSGGFDDSSTY